MNVGGSMYWAVVVGVGLAASVARAAMAESEAPPPRQEFLVEGRPAFIIAPTKKLPGPTPWVLYAPTLGKGLPGAAENWMFRQWLDAGIAIAGVDVGESYGSPKGRETYTALHKQLTEQHGFAAKASLLARSRGGLMLYCWAADNPEKVRCIAGIYPVCNLASYPGLARACGAYGLTEAQLKAELARHNPVDRPEPLARAGVPIFHIHGDKDATVPLAENSALLAKRYRDAGGTVTLRIAEGQGHNMWRGFFECQALVDFVIRHSAAAPAATSPATQPTPATPATQATQPTQPTPAGTPKRTAAPSKLHRGAIEIPVSDVQERPYRIGSAFRLLPFAFLGFPVPGLALRASRFPVPSSPLWGHTAGSGLPSTRLGALRAGRQFLTQPAIALA